MLPLEDHLINETCCCRLGNYTIEVVRDLIDVYNHLIFDFDFDIHQLSVERLSDEASSNSVPRENPISYYRVNIEKLAKETRGFNHASCNCAYLSVEVDQFSFLDYTYLSHVHLKVAQNTDHMFVLATYCGIAAL